MLVGGYQIENKQVKLIRFRSSKTSAEPGLSSLFFYLLLLYEREHNYYANYFRQIFTYNMLCLLDLPIRCRIEHLDKKLAQQGKCKGGVLWEKGAGG